MYHLLKHLFMDNSKSNRETCLLDVMFRVMTSKKGHVKFIEQIVLVRNTKTRLLPPVTLYPLSSCSIDEYKSLFHGHMSYPFLV